MLTPVSPSDLGEEMIPQAIIGRPTSHFETALETKFVKGHDDLDEYYIAAFRIESQGLVFALKHYPGYPENTTTVYLPERIRTLETITYIIGVIAHELRVPREWIIWQRADGPDL